MDKPESVAWKLYNRARTARYGAMCETRCTISSSLLKAQAHTFLRENINEAITVPSINPRTNETPTTERAAFGFPDPNSIDTRTLPHTNHVCHPFEFNGTQNTLIPWSNTI